MSKKVLKLKLNSLISPMSLQILYRMKDTIQLTKKDIDFKPSDYKLRTKFMFEFQFIYPFRQFEK